LRYSFSPLCDRLVPENFINSHIDSSCSAFLSSSASTSTSTAQPASTSVSKDHVESATNDHVPGKKRKAGIENEAAPSSSSPSLSRPPSTASTNPSSSKRPRLPPPSKPTAKQNTTASHLNSARPLPDLVRPQSLEDLIGQEHLLGEGMLLRGLIERDRVGSCLFWGPPVSPSFAINEANVHISV